MRILVVEDQPDLNEIIERKMKNEHYTVDAVLTGEDALDYIRCAEYDGIIMDIMMPGITGIGVLKEMRNRGIETPVLLLTALGTTEDKVAGLDAGADDYLVKPFDFDELLARVRAMTRRKGEKTENVICAGDLRVDKAARTVSRGGKEIKLTAREFDILELLLRNRGRVMSRDRIINNLWNFDYDGASNVVDVFIHHLRKKVDGDAEFKLIETVKGAGYIIR